MPAAIIAALLLPPKTLVIIAFAGALEPYLIIPPNITCLISSPLTPFDIFPDANLSTTPPTSSFSQFTLYESDKFLGSGRTIEAESRLTSTKP